MAPRSISAMDMRIPELTFRYERGDRGDAVAARSRRMALTGT